MSEKRSFAVRRATRDDAVAGTELVRASITELCVADHQNDPATLAHWLANKTPENFERWLANPDNYLVVAENDSHGEDEARLACVGCLNRRGEVLLCYAHPESKGSGAGGAILRELEAQAARWALTELRLTSTGGARAFYEHHGFVSAGEPLAPEGVRIGHPYVKRLDAIFAARTPRAPHQ